METYEKKYKEALEKARQLCAYPTTKPFIRDLQDIFPELKGSEDEKIRKELIEFVKSRGGFKQEYIAWLEKQGKPTEINPSEFDSQLNRLLGQFKSLPKEELTNSLSFYLNVVQNDGTYKEEKQGEQKPNPCENCSIATNNCQKFPCTIRDGEQKPAWSEEDEKILSNIIKDLVHPWNEYIPDRIEDEIKWLKNKLKSLRPQSHWKPSDEQMKALESIFAKHGAYDDDLLSLINDLKKLKG